MAHIAHGAWGNAMAHLPKRSVVSPVISFCKPNKIDAVNLNFPSFQNVFNDLLAYRPVF